MLVDIIDVFVGGLVAEGLFLEGFDSWGGKLEEFGLQLGISAVAHQNEGVEFIHFHCVQLSIMCTLKVLLGKGCEVHILWLLGAEDLQASGEDGVNLHEFLFQQCDASILSLNRSCCLDVRVNAVCKFIAEKASEKLMLDTEGLVSVATRFQIGVVAPYPCPEITKGRISAELCWL